MGAPSICVSVVPLATVPSVSDPLVPEWFVIVILVFLLGGNRISWRVVATKVVVGYGV